MSNAISSQSWEGSRITRYTPNGEIDIIVSISTAYCVTAACFGGSSLIFFHSFTKLRPASFAFRSPGPNLDKLYITTASPKVIFGEDTAEGIRIQADYPHSGDLFMLDLRGEFREGKWRYSFGA